MLNKSPCCKRYLQVQFAEFQDQIVPLDSNQLPVIIKIQIDIFLKVIELETRFKNFVKKGFTITSKTSQFAESRFVRHQLLTLRTLIKFAHS